MCPGNVRDERTFNLLSFNDRFLRDFMASRRYSAVKLSQKRLTRPEDAGRLVRPRYVRPITITPTVFFRNVYNPGKRTTDEIITIVIITTIIGERNDF